MTSVSTRSLPYAHAKRHGVAIVMREGEAWLGIRDGASASAIAEARRAAGGPMRFERLSSADFDRMLSEIYAGEALASAGADGMPPGFAAPLDALPAAADLLDPQDDAPIIRMINGLIAEAVRVGASDIHIEPYEKTLVVRLRVDGVMREVLTLPSSIAPMLVSRIKVMARLDIADKRMPQDGRISLAFGAKALDVRVSTLPSRTGERVVMRVLDKEQGAFSLAELGMPPHVLGHMVNALREPNGIVLVTGPTGSGKTTTLYAGLGSLNDQSRNILTVEDPVEYTIHGVGQTQINPKVGLTFAVGLRAILRQDPNIVMVGEIRDAETAQIAVQASLTGHLVLSTVHTNDAVGAITRLRDMGVEPFLLSSTLRLIIAQRLVRRLCTQCRAPHPADAATARLVGVEPGHILYRPCGCAACRMSGYQGRIGIYEAVRITDELRGLIGQNASEQEILAALGETRDLAHSARALVAEGLTSAEEAIRATRQEAQVDGGV